jgi:hypothetical protein
MLRSLVAAALVCAACVPAPTDAHGFAAPSAPTLRAIPAAHGLAVGERRTVRAVLEEGSERVATIALGDNAVVEHPEVATLDGDAIVAVAAGNTTLKIDHNGQSISVPIVVTDAALSKLVLDPIAPCRMGERVPVRATAHYADGTTGDATLDAQWSTPTSALLLVPNTPETRGAVVAISPKTSVLRAELGQLQAATEIAPGFGEPSGIVVRLAWSYGGFRRFGAFAHWSDRQEVEVSAGCLWRVDKEAFRGIERPTMGPWVPVSELSWDRNATCELGSGRATAALFAP